MLKEKILKEAIDKARGKKKEDPPPNIIVHYSCNFPESYVPLLEDRLYFYQSLAISDTKEKVCDIENDGDLSFEGEITSYSIKPIAIQANETARQNRLTIKVLVKFENKKVMKCRNNLKKCEKITKNDVKTT